MGKMSNYEIFERLRDLKIQIDKLRDDYRREVPTVQSPKLDGMPKQHGAGDAGAAWVDKRDSLARRIQCSENEYRNKLKAAEKLMEGMPHDLFRFCQCYYIGAYDIDHVCVVLEFSRRTFYNRQKALVEYLEGVTGRYETNLQKGNSSNFK